VCGEPPNPPNPDPQQQLVIQVPLSWLSVLSEEEAVQEGAASTTLVLATFGTMVREARTGSMHTLS
jgi:hypothetical protein